MSINIHRSEPRPLEMLSLLHHIWTSGIIRMWYPRSIRNFDKSLLIIIWNNCNLKFPKKVDSSRGRQCIGHHMSLTIIILQMTSWCSPISTTLSSSLKICWNKECPKTKHVEAVRFFHLLNTIITYCQKPWTPFNISSLQVPPMYVHT